MQSNEQKIIIQIPIDLSHLEPEIIEILGSEVKIEKSDLHRKPIGGPGFELILGFVISFLASEAVSGFLKGLGIDVQRPFKSLGRATMQIPSRVKNIFGWYRLSKKLFFKESAAGYLKIFVHLNAIRLCFYFGGINDLQDFYRALSNIERFVIEFLSLLSDKFKSEKEGLQETIILKWEKDEWKIDEFLSRLLS